MAKTLDFFFLTFGQCSFDFYMNYVFFISADIFSRPIYVLDTVYAELYAKQQEWVGD